MQDYGLYNMTMNKVKATKQTQRTVAIPGIELFELRFLTYWSVQQVD